MCPEHHRGVDDAAPAEHAPVYESRECGVVARHYPEGTLTHATATATTAAATAAAFVCGALSRRALPYNDGLTPYDMDVLMSV